jgi:hypothetical protein
MDSYDIWGKNFGGPTMLTPHTNKTAKPPKGSNWAAVVRSSPMF